MNNKFVFFGTSKFSTIILDELKERGFIPALIITQEDKPQGRHMAITPPPVKKWAIENNIPFIQPATPKNPSLYSKLKTQNYSLFIVASYGKIIPKNILDIPEKQTLNVHPSLLPRLRGPSPIQSAILTEEKTGVTIIRLDEEMDHGPILAQKEIPTPEWPMYATELEILLAHEGGKLLSEIIPNWINGEIKETPQNHEEATYCKKIKKEDAFIDLSGEAKLNLRKIRGYAGWPNAYTNIETKNGPLRLTIKSAHIDNEILVLDQVIPTGKKEMNFKDFERGFLLN